MGSTLCFKKLWLAIGWSLVGFVIFLSLASPPSSSNLENTFLNFLIKLPYIDKVGHLIAYFILMGWFAQIYQTPRQRISYLVGFILLGILLEILQGLGGIRTADWTDELANSFGVLLAWQVTKKHFNEILFNLEHIFLREFS